MGYQKKWGVFNGSTSSVRTSTTVTHGSTFYHMVAFQRGTPSGEDIIVSRWGDATQICGYGFIGGTTDLKINFAADATWRTIKASLDTKPHLLEFSYDLYQQDS